MEKKPSFGERLAMLRKTNGFTQDEVAENMGVTPQAVSKWENNAACPDITALPRLADMYKVTVDELLRPSDAEKTIVRYVPAEQRKPIEEMYLRIYVKSGEDKVKVNLPMAIIKIILEGGANLGSMMNVGGVDLSKIDLNAVMSLVERGIIGRLVEVETEDGENVIIEVV